MSSPKGERVEPLVKPMRAARSRSELRLDPSDRIGGQQSASTKKPRSNKPKRGRGKSGGRGIRNFPALLRRGLYWLLILGIWATIALGGVIAYYGARLPAMTSWAVPERPPNIKILGVDGNVIANRGDTGGEQIKLKQIPPYVPQAVIAIEDRRFYSHFGIDPIGLARAALSNLRAGNVRQGGSTLTQQLAKNLFLKPDRTFERKIQEVILSLWLEARYSKDEILEMYLNRVYLGAGAYGVDAAARRYFAKPASQLALAEAAVIAGLLKAPSHYSPLNDLNAAEARSQTVLAAMLDSGFITEREMSLALSAKVDPVKPPAAGSFGYAADWIADLVPGLVGSLKEDVVVDTTIDMRLQAEAAKALEEGLARDGKTYRVGQGALVAMEPDGAVRALVGGRDYGVSQFNRAVEAKRQPGSAFKPFAYLAALERGYLPETVRIDQPVAIGNWRPQNYTDSYSGPVTLQSALAFSLNSVAAQLVAEIGPKAVIGVAQRLGIKSDLQPNPSIALGTSEVSLLELTGAYAPFASGGYGATPYVIKRIRNSAGKTLYERTEKGPGAVVAASYVGMMNSMLRESVHSGTGTKAALKGWDVAGKTGTSQDYRDAWFVGYTASMLTGVWFGNDDGSPMRKNTGGGLPAQVWAKFMGLALAGRAPADLPGNYRYGDPSHGAEIARAGRPTAVDEIVYGEDSPVAPIVPGRPSATPVSSQQRVSGSPARNAAGDFAGPIPPAEIGAQSSGNDARGERSPGGFLRRLFGG